MNRRVLIVVALVGLIALSGCSMFDGSENTTTTTTTAPTTEAPTTTANNSTDDTGETVNISTAMLDDHQAALEAAGSFSSNMKMQMESNKSLGMGQSSITITSAAKVNMDAHRYLSIKDGFASKNARYTTANATFMKRNSSFSEKTEYKQATPPYDDSPRTVSPVDPTQAMGVTEDSVLQFAFGDNISYEAAGTTTVDGVTVTKYHADGVANKSAFAEQFAAQGDMELRNSSFTILVDENNVMRNVSYQMTFANKSVEQKLSVTFTVTDVGSTTVSPPAWVDKARKGGNTTAQACEFKDVQFTASRDTNYENETVTITVNLVDKGSADSFSVRYENGTVAQTLTTEGEHTVTLDANGNPAVYANADGCDSKQVYP